MSLKKLVNKLKMKIMFTSIGSKGTNYFRRTHQGPINTDFASLNSTLAFDEVTKLVKVSQGSFILIKKWEV